MRTYRHFLFDLDGTLTDSMPGITRCVQLALRHFGIEVGDLNVLRPFVGPPLRDSFREYYALTAEEAEEAVEIYGRRYNTEGLYENKVYEGIAEILETLKNGGARLSVATSKPTALAERILSHYGLRGYFGTVSGGEPEGPRALKAGVIECVLKDNEITDRSAALMIGDRKHDLLGAQSAGIDSAGVLWGYGGAEELETFHATHILREPAELSRFLFSQDTTTLSDK